MGGTFASPVSPAAVFWSEVDVNAPTQDMRSPARFLDTAGHKGLASMLSVQSVHMFIRSVDPLPLE